MPTLRWLLCCVGICLFATVSGCTAAAPESASDGFAPFFNAQLQPQDVPPPRWVLRTTDTIGPVQRAVLTEDVAYLATPADLYRVDPTDGEPDPVQVATSEEARAKLVLAPGGYVFAWLLPGPDPEPEEREDGTIVIPPRLDVKRIVEVRRIDEPNDGPGLGTLGLEQGVFPFGYDAIFMGYQGRLIVTASPLESLDGDGAYLYKFWKQTDERTAYEYVGYAAYSQPQLGFFEPCGRAIVLIGPDSFSEDSFGEASFSEAFPAEDSLDPELLNTESVKLFGLSGNGFEKLVEVPGSYRNAEVAMTAVEGRWMVLLNPARGEGDASQFRRVDLLDSFGGALLRVEFPMPVFDLVAEADGSQAAVVGEFLYYLLNLDEIVGEIEEIRESAGEEAIPVTSLPHTLVNLRAFEMISSQFQIANFTFSGPQEETVSVLHWDENGAPLVDASGSLFDPELPYRGTILTIDGEGQPAQHNMAISVQTAFVPRSDSVYDSGQFVGYTEDYAILVGQYNGEANQCE